MNEEIVLRTAFSWDCPSCSHENFEHAILAEMSQEDREEAIRLMYGIDEWDKVPEELGCELMMAPTNVKCDLCGEEYPVMRDDFGEEETDVEQQ